MYLSSHLRQLVQSDPSSDLENDEPSDSAAEAEPSSTELPTAENPVDTAVLVAVVLVCVIVLAFIVVYALWFKKVPDLEADELEARAKHKKQSTRAREKAKKKNANAAKKSSSGGAQVLPLSEDISREVLAAKQFDAETKGNQFAGAGPVQTGKRVRNVQQTEVRLHFCGREAKPAANERFPREWNKRSESGNRPENLPVNNGVFKSIREFSQQGRREDSFSHAPISIIDQPKGRNSISSNYRASRSTALLDGAGKEVSRLSKGSVSKGHAVEFLKNRYESGVIDDNDLAVMNNQNTVPQRTIDILKKSLEDELAKQSRMTTSRDVSNTLSRSDLESYLVENEESQIGSQSVDLNNLENMGLVSWAHDEEDTRSPQKMRIQNFTSDMQSSAFLHVLQSPQLEGDAPSDFESDLEDDNLPFKSAEPVAVH